MNDIHDLELTIRSHIPLIVIETHEERRVLELLEGVFRKLKLPLFRWTITEGIDTVTNALVLETAENKPVQVLEQIKHSDKPSGYVLLDFHPYLDNPFHVRLLKEIALTYDQTPRTIILLSHKLSIPEELKQLSAHFELSMPSEKEVRQLVTDIAERWTSDNPGKKVKTNQEALQLLVKNLAGLTMEDAHRLAKKAIYDDGAITDSDVKAVMQAKYQLLNRDGVLSFEYETATFGDVAGLLRLKSWLEQRQAVFQGKLGVWKLDSPKGILLLGVQGCGKSLAAKAVAGVWGVPLLRLDFGAIYDKFIGETEKRLKQSLQNAEVMAPCVLWLDEIEKGLSTGDTDSGTSRRVMGSLLTWMAEKKAPVFLVATANDITVLPPELVRKGRFDEIFFVDLPDYVTRVAIFEIHLKKRDLDPERFNLDSLATHAEGFSGAEIEAAIVSAFYSALAQKELISDKHITDELGQTRPLSVTMGERIDSLRAWAEERTVPAQ